MNKKMVLKKASISNFHKISVREARLLILPSLESFNIRFRLRASKVSYALLQKLHNSMNEIPLKRLISSELHEALNRQFSKSNADATDVDTDSDDDENNMLIAGAPKGPGQKGFGTAGGAKSSKNSSMDGLVVGLLRNKLESDLKADGDNGAGGPSVDSDNGDNGAGSGQVSAIYGRYSNIPLAEQEPKILGDRGFKYIIQTVENPLHTIGFYAGIVDIKLPNSFLNVKSYDPQDRYACMLIASETARLIEQDRANLLPEPKVENPRIGNFFFEI